MQKVIPVFLQGGTYVSRIKSREGPTISFICLYKNECHIFFTKKEVIKFCQLNKGLSSRVAFDEWWDTYCMDDFPELTPTTEDIKKISWGPEAHEEPNDNTKMVT
tara:strand:+ start:576 stop:890 length:315 start_codon:yes stop_codon:yes gene_type:complete